MSRQARRWGEYNVLLYKLYRGRGMPSIGWSSGPRNWVNLLRRCPSLLRESQRPGWLWETNWALGRLVGSIKHRVYRSEEHTSELQSLMRISYAVFCLKKKTYASHVLRIVPTF